jgi:hypothetical protein
MRSPYRFRPRAAAKNPTTTGVLLGFKKTNSNKSLSSRQISRKNRRSRGFRGVLYTPFMRIHPDPGQACFSVWPWLNPSATSVTASGSMEGTQTRTGKYDLKIPPTAEAQCFRRAA